MSTETTPGGSRSPALTDSCSQAVFRQMKESVLLIDGSGVVSYANRAAHDVLGLADGDLIGVPFERVQPNGDVLLDALRNAGSLQDVEQSWMAPGDREVVVQLSASLVDDGDGEFRSVLIARDVSRSRRSEEALRQSEEHHRQLVELSPDLISIHCDDQIVYMNLPGLRMLGAQSLADVVGRPAWEFMHPRDARFIRRRLRHMGLFRRAPRAEARLIRLDGQEVSVEISATPFSYMGKPALQVFAHDITERKASERAVRESESRFRRLVELSPDIISIVQGQRIVFVNSPGAALLGAASPSAVVGKSAWEFVHPDSRERAHERLMLHMSGQVPPREMLKYQRTDGRVLHVEVEGRSLTYNDRPAVQVIARDVTERVDAERARRRAEQELEAQRALSMRSDRLRSLGEMAAGIAHELNQPLVGVRGLAEHILIGLDRDWELSGDKLRERMSRIVDQADRMVHIINHVRMFAREAGNADVSPVEANEVVRSAMDMVGAQFRSHGLDLVCELADGLPLISANPYSLEEVVINLLNNARDAVEDRYDKSDGDTRGRVTLQTRQVGEEGEAWLRIDVEDNGSGIPRDIIDRVFDPFYTTKGPDEGTGLGLAISKSIVEGFHGRIQLTSEACKGTTVSVLLPGKSLDPEACGWEVA